MHDKESMNNHISIDDDTLTAHNKMMLHFFLMCGGTKEQQLDHLESGLSLLRSGKVHPHEQDNNLVRELRVNRWIPEYQEKIYTELVRQCIAHDCIRDHYKVR